MEAGTFREDLYYRINVLRVHLPPLRERRECIEPLSDYLLEKICRELKRNFSGFAPGVTRTFQTPSLARERAGTFQRY